MAENIKRKKPFIPQWEIKDLNYKCPADGIFFCGGISVKGYSINQSVNLFFWKMTYREPVCIQIVGGLAAKIEKRTWGTQRTNFEDFW